ncbi:HAD-IIIC family phosphatase [Sulfurimonas sp. HSL-1716]|uniref:HAD-IIIC family phosphatase n=1 Tax=Hydrocurvibacter sulfurireducens TaxID=3131937 RepID=UPI0031F76E4B
MNTNSIAFLSNTVTKPFDRFLKEYSLTHYPLDTIIDTLYAKVDEQVLILLLDSSFFADDHDESFAVLKNALLHFRMNNSAKIIINTLNEEFNDIFTPDKIRQELELAKLNCKIASLQEELNGLAVLDFYTMCKEHGTKNLISQRNRYLFQTPFTKLATELLSAKIQELISLFDAPRIKAIAVDADNTLWGGIIGEDGLGGIKIDNNYPGIVYTKFQEYLLELKNSGIILILLSKNDENAVQEVFETKTMPLGLDDFVAHAVNWNSKSENLNAVLKELGLTKTGIIFIDDSDAELAEMRQRMGIECYKMNPANPLLNIETLKKITALKTLHISAEDAKKTTLYKDEKERLDLSSKMPSKEDFIASLGIRIGVTCNNEKNIERITQLINKTNQFNLTTKRYELSFVKELMQSGFVYDFSVKDKFGDMGIVGVVIIKDGDIDTFLMSCRVLGRGIEESVLNFITRRHQDLTASYCKTDKNALVEEFYEKNGFEAVKNGDCKHYKFKRFADVNESIKVEYGS